MKTWKEMSGWERTKILIFSMLPALILLFVANWYAGMVIYRDVALELDPITGNPAIYKMHFGRGAWGQTTETPVNTLGFPDKEFVNITPKGDCYHIVVTGDSFTFGDAVDRHRNWFTLIERALAREFPDRCIRMFNIGQRMSTIQEQQARLRETWQLLDPDLVILAQYQNDLTDLTNPGNIASAPVGQPTDDVWWGDVIRQRVPFSNAALVRYLTYQAFKFMITNDLHYDILNQWSVLADDSNKELATKLSNYYRDFYMQVVQDVKKDGVDFGVVILPSKLDILAGRSPEEPFFEGLAKEVGAPYISLMEPIEKNRRDYPYQMYDGHLSPAGNAVVAREVFRWLFEAPQAPFPKLRAAVDGTALPVSGPMAASR